MYKYFMSLFFFILSSTAMAQDFDVDDLEDLEALQELGELSIDDEEIKVGNQLKIDSDGIQVNEDLSIDAKGLRAGNVAINSTSSTGKIYDGDDFFNVNWSGKDLSGATFISVNFYEANLTNVDFSNAIFSNTDFSGVNLDGACFFGASLSNTDVDEDSSMINTNFTNSTRSNTDFSVDTSQVVWDKVKCGKSKPVELSMRADLIDAGAIITGLSKGENAGIDLTINFSTDSAKIAGKAHAQVYEVAKALNSDQLNKNNFLIVGHTDSDGDDEYNIDLSYRRALAVSRTLSDEYSIESVRLSVKGFGESKPVTSNFSAQGKALNRRVTIVNLGAAVN